MAKERSTAEQFVVELHSSSPSEREAGFDVWLCSCRQIRLQMHARARGQRAHTAGVN